MVFKKITVLISVFCLIFCLCSCGSDKDSDLTQSEFETLKNSAPKITVTVIDNDGNAVEGVVLQIRKESVLTARTNRAGKAVFPLAPINGYKLSVISCPDGYEYTGEIYIHINQGVSDYTLEITKK